MIDVQQITALHGAMVVRWHQQTVDNPYEGFLAIVCTQHSHNFLLWHEQDVGRRGDIGDARMAQVKRAIDRYNQQRNDWIEKIDIWLSDELNLLGIAPVNGAPLNTETPGSAIDRLSILALRRYHLEVQARQSSMSEARAASIHNKLEICESQHRDLSTALAQLLEDIFAGRKRHKIYRHLKTYEEPSTICSGNFAQKVPATADRCC